MASALQVMNTTRAIAAAPLILFMIISSLSLLFVYLQGDRTEAAMKVPSLGWRLVASANLVASQRCK